MIPNPIHKVLSTFQNCKVRALLMGGQACVFYGGAEFSRDTDFAILANQENLERLSEALRQLDASLIAVPQLSLEDALYSEERGERQADKAYWVPLKLELGQLRGNVR